LAAGDVWKYGTTKNPETRYSETFLNSTGQGLMYQTISSGTKAEALAAEKASILNYITESGALPPGNKIIR